MPVPVITIDGPAASGKTSLAQALARDLSYHLLISGVLYRGVAYLLRDMERTLDNTGLLLARIKSAKITFRSDQSGVRVYLNGQDLSEIICNEVYAGLASRLSAVKEVRAALIDYQRSFHKPPGLVAEGRDMGSVVFPEAAIKVYLTASSSVRAHRRYRQLQESGIDVKIDDVHRQILERDEQDISRSISPLRPASDAVLMDNTKQSLEETIAKIVELKKAVYG